MPEGDTVYKTARMLSEALAGRNLTSTSFRVPRFANVNLKDQIVTEAVARGKHILIRTDAGNTIHSHLGMDGSWRVGKVNAPLSRNHGIRVVLETDETRAVGSLLKIIEVLTTAQEVEVVGHLGPDILGPDWDLDRASKNLEAHPDMLISDALLDQRLVAGLGNVYRNEICFLRGYHPFLPVSDCDIRPTLELAKKVMEANREFARHVTTGDPRPGRQRYVYGRRGQPCRRCGTAITRKQEGLGRVAYWCPRCQPERHVVGFSQRLATRY